MFLLQSFTFLPLGRFGIRHHFHNEQKACQFVTSRIAGTKHVKYTLAVAQVVTYIFEDSVMIVTLRIKLLLWIACGFILLTEVDAVQI